jgi:putative transposase
MLGEMNDDIPKLSHEVAFAEEKTSTRNESIQVAYKSGQFSLNEIGDYFGLHYSSISKIVKKL